MFKATLVWHGQQIRCRTFVFFVKKHLHFSGKYDIINRVYMYKNTEIAQESTFIYKNKTNIEVNTH